MKAFIEDKYKLKIFNAVKTFTFTAVLALLSLKLIQAFDISIGQISLKIANVNIVNVFTAVFLIVVYQLLNSSMWSKVLGLLGQEVEVFTSMRLWMSSEACKWLPGGVWTVASRALLAKKIGVNKEIAMKSMAIELLTVVISWFLLALLFSAYVFKQVQGFILYFCEHYMPLVFSHKLLFAVILLLALSLVALFFVALLQKVKKTEGYLRVFSSFNQLSTQPFKQLPKLVFAFFLLAFFNSVIFFYVSGSILENELSLGLAVACNALAWLVGFFALFAPGGVGVREAVIVFFLSPQIGVENSIACAALWRSLQVLGELISLALINLVSLIAKFFRFNVYGVLIIR